MKAEHRTFGLVSRYFDDDRHWKRNLFIILLVVFLIGLAYSIIVEPEEGARRETPVKYSLDRDVIEQLKAAERIKINYSIAGAGAEVRTGGGEE